MGIVLMIAAMTSFTILDSIAKHLAATYPVPMIVWARYFVHVVLMVLLLGPRMRGQLVRTERPGLQVARGAILGLASILFFTSLSMMPLADASALTQVAPILTTIAAVFWLGERAPRTTWVALIVSFIGVLLIIRPAGGGAVSWAALLPLATAVCFAGYSLITRKLAGVDNGLTTLFIGGLVAAVVMSMIVPSYWKTPLSALDTLLLIFTGIIGAIGHLLVVRAFERAPASLLAPFSYTQMVAATIFGYLMFDQFPDYQALIGMVMILVTGVALAMVRRKW